MKKYIAIAVLMLGLFTVGCGAPNKATTPPPNLNATNALQWFGVASGFVSDPVTTYGNPPYNFLFNIHQNPGWIIAGVNGDCAEITGPTITNGPNFSITATSPYVGNPDSAALEVTGVVMSYNSTTEQYTATGTITFVQSMCGENAGWSAPFTATGVMVVH